ncbi:MAG: hypothetical protein R3F13_13950 [Prosthecobacter sp.]
MKDFPKRAITVNGAVDALIDYLYDMIAHCDAVRVSLSVPNPLESSGFFENFNGFLHSIGGDWYSVVRKRSPIWVEDYQCRGWLDGDNPERSLSSPCDVNPYCWFSLVTSAGVAFSEAILDFKEDCFKKDNGKRRVYGPVRSRLSQQLLPRGRGRPKKPPPKRVRVVGPKGRPEKKTTRWVIVNQPPKGEPMVGPVLRQRQTFATATLARRGRGRVGRPAGVKDSPNSQRAKDNKLKKILSSQVAPPPKQQKPQRVSTEQPYKRTKFGAKIYTPKYDSPGRPKKKTVRWLVVNEPVSGRAKRERVVFDSVRESRKGTGRLGRPKGVKDSPKSDRQQR